MDFYWLQFAMFGEWNFPPAEINRIFGFCVYMRHPNCDCHAAATSVDKHTLATWNNARVKIRIFFSSLHIWDALLHPKISTSTLSSTSLSADTCLTRQLSATWFFRDRFRWRWHNNTATTTWLSHFSPRQSSHFCLLKSDNNNNKRKRVGSYA